MPQLNFTDIYQNFQSSVVQYRATKECSASKILTILRLVQKYFYHDSKYFYRKCATFKKHFKCFFYDFFVFLLRISSFFFFFYQKHFQLNSKLDSTHVVNHIYIRHYLSQFIDSCHGMYCLLLFDFFVAAITNSVFRIQSRFLKQSRLQKLTIPLYFLGSFTLFYWPCKMFSAYIFCVLLYIPVHVITLKYLLYFKNQYHTSMPIIQVYILF